MAGFMYPDELSSTLNQKRAEEKEKVARPPQPPVRYRPSATSPFPEPLARALGLFGPGARKPATPQTQEQLQRNTGFPEPLAHTLGPHGTPKNNTATLVPNSHPYSPTSPFPPPLAHAMGPLSTIKPSADLPSLPGFTTQERRELFSPEPLARARGELPPITTAYAQIRKLIPPEFLPPKIIIRPETPPDESENAFAFSPDDQTPTSLAERPNIASPSISISLPDTRTDTTGPQTPPDFKPADDHPDSKGSRTIHGYHSQRRKKVPGRVKSKNNPSDIGTTSSALTAKQLLDKYGVKNFLYPGLWLQTPEGKTSGGNPTPEGTGTIGGSFWAFQPNEKGSNFFWLVKPKDYPNFIKADAKKNYEGVNWAISDKKQAEIYAKEKRAEAPAYYESISAEGSYIIYQKSKTTVFLGVKKAGEKTYEQKMGIAIRGYYYPVLLTNWHNVVTTQDRSQGKKCTEAKTCKEVRTIQTSSSPDRQRIGPVFASLTRKITGTQTEEDQKKPDAALVRISAPGQSFPLDLPMHITNSKTKDTTVLKLMDLSVVGNNILSNGTRRPFPTNLQTKGHYSIFEDPSKLGKVPVLKISTNGTGTTDSRGVRIGYGKIGDIYTQKMRINPSADYSRGFKVFPENENLINDKDISGDSGSLVFGKDGTLYGLASANDNNLSLTGGNWLVHHIQDVINSFAEQQIFLISGILRLSEQEFGKFLKDGIIGKVVLPLNG